MTLLHGSLGAAFSVVLALPRPLPSSTAIRSSKKAVLFD